MINILYLFNNKEEYLYSITDYKDSMYKRKVPNEWTFSFNVKLELNSDIKKGAKIGVYDRHNIFRLFIVTNVLEDYDEEIMTVNTVNDYLGLDYTIIEDKRVVGGTSRDAFNKVIEGSGYTLRTLEPTENITTNFHFTSRLEGLNNLLTYYNAEVDPHIEFSNNKITNKYLDILFSIGIETNIHCTYDTNLTSLQREFIEEDHFTVLYGRGKSLETENGGYSRKLTFENVTWKTPTNPTDKPKGDKFIEDTKAIERWGRIEGIFEDNDIEIQEELLQKTWDKLQECKNPKVVYSGSIEDLHNLKGFEHYDIKYGDTILLINEDKDLTVSARLIDEEYSLEDSNVNIVLGNFYTTLSELTEGDNIGDIIQNVVDKIDTNVNDTKFPNTLPQIPVLTGIGGLDSIALSWTYESKSYYVYELYGSQVQGFTPNFTNLIFKGKSSNHIHKVQPKETWYYKISATNTHNQSTDFSAEFSISTTKITDGTIWIEDGAIGNALIGDLRADRAWIGKFQGEYINAKNLEVIDGNGKRTLHIDSFGNVNMDVSNLRISSKDVATIDSVKSTIEQNPNSVKIGFNKINNNIQFNESEMQINTANGKSLTLKNGRLNAYDSSDGKVLGYIGQTYTNVNGIRHPGNVFGNAYNSYYTVFGLDSNYASDNQQTGKNFDAFMTIVYYAHNNLSRGVYFNKPLYFNDASPIYAGEINLANNIVPKYPNTSYSGTLAYPWRGVYTNLVKSGTFNLTLATANSGSNYGEIIISDDGFIYPSWGNGKFDLGTNNARFGVLRCVSPVNVSSDRNLKENIKPILTEKKFKTASNDDSTITYEDMYDFIRNDLELNTYNYKDVKYKNTEIGFIAQDLIDTKIGKEIIVEDDTLSYSEGSYINVLAGALKKAIEKIEYLESIINA